MPVFTVPIHEFNPNHEPAGSEIGGQFATKQGGKDTSAHPVVRDRGMWGSSHGNSKAMAAVAAQMMGIPGYVSPRFADAPSMKWEPSDELVKHIEKFLIQIGSDTVGAEEPLYHGFQNVGKVEFKTGDTFKIPLTATSGDLEDSAGYGLRLDRRDQEGEPTVFAFPSGTPMVAYSKWGKTDAEDFGYVYSEAIVAGEFRVVRAERQTLRKPQHDSSNISRSGAQWHPTTDFMVVHVEPTGVFDMATRSWKRRG